ncbi:MAG: hypothetical protein WD009_13675 [Phycisphaeraceae bacterium]
MPHSKTATRRGVPRHQPPRRDHRQRGVAAVLAMLFMVIFGSLAAAMAIVSQGNLATADAHMKINRSLAAAETGMHVIEHRLREIANGIKTTQGEVDADLAEDLWQEVRQALAASFASDQHSLAVPSYDEPTLTIGPITMGDNAPEFIVTLTPHPLAGEDYDGPQYQRAAYDGLDLPLDARWVRVRVTAYDGPEDRRVYRSVTKDFRIDKRIPYAVLARSRIMIGQHVMIDGPIGSRFTETHLEHGHPIHMVSDFRGLTAELDEELDVFVNTLIGEESGGASDLTGNNRLNLSHSDEVEGITDPGQYDIDGDGYIDEWDFFLGHFGRYDTDTGEWYVLKTDLESGADDPIRAAELFELIKTFSPSNDPNRLDSRDRYAKIRGEVYISATQDSWESGAAGGPYQDYFQGPIHPDFGKDPIEFDSASNEAYEFGPEDFDVSSFRNRASTSSEGDFAAQVAANIANGAPVPYPHVEEVPYGAENPYEHYERLVYEDMTFENVLIPPGTNALFKNCVFIGVTFIETETANDHPDYNYAGMMEHDGTPKFPDHVAVINGEDVPDTKERANNIRFDDAIFHGGIVTDAPQAYTHVRNKLQFTGETRFVIDNPQDFDQIEPTDYLNADDQRLFRRSTLLAPHYSIEMGTFTEPANPDQMTELHGTIVAGLVDMRGNIRVTGTILSTFQPTSNEGPVIGETSPWFTMAIGYFDQDSGDMEAAVPEVGRGMIHIRYDPTTALPDGINGPIEVRPIAGSYFESGK